jgi:hypothetical protein
LPSSQLNAPTAQVEYTISEDRAAGDAAHAESGFARLAAAPLAAFSQPGTLAPEDYQMQLMLLETQNKERLRLAREEHDAAQGSRREPLQPHGRAMMQQPPALSGMVPGQMVPPLVLQQRQIPPWLAMLAQATQQQHGGSMDAANVSMDLDDFEADIQASDEIQPEAVTEPQNSSEHVVLYRVVCAAR